MPDGDAPKEFPDVSQKLSAPKKLSAFEKERQAAEQKRRREEAENKALLETFEQDFEQDEGSNNDDFDGFPRFGQPPSGPRGSGMAFGGPPGRSGAPPRSGPGSLGPVPGAHVPNLKRKRQLDELREAQEARRDHEDFTAEYLGRKDGHAHHASRGRDEETQYDVAPRPTVQLSNLPPSSSEQDVKAMLRGQLQVYSVQFQPPPGPVSTGRRSATAIAQLSTETSTQQIESAVSTLKGKYLGCGYTLSISRHLSSTSLQANMPIAVSASSAEPFGAQKIDRDQPARFSMRTAPPLGQFAPPGFQEPRGQHSAPAKFPG
jgi:U2-associated protein SR140